MAALRLSWSFETNMRFVGTVDKHIPIVGARIDFADLTKGCGYFTGLDQIIEFFTEDALSELVSSERSLIMWSTVWCRSCMSSCIFAISVVKFTVLIFIVYSMSC
jgi:hypothetical protein